MSKILFASWNCKDPNDYLYPNWYSPLKKIASKFAMFDPKERYYAVGKEAMNKEFLQHISKEKPDFVYLTSIYDEMPFETFLKAKKISPKTKFINFFSDDEWRFDNYSKYFSPYIEFCISSYPEAYKKAKKLELDNFYLVLNTYCNADVCKKLDVKKIYEVSFIGQPTKERAEMLAFLIEKGVSVNIWGKSWDKLPNYEVYKKHHRGIATDLPLITNQSKIMLAFLMDDIGTRIQIKGRLAEVGGCGTFQIATANEQTQQILADKKEAIYFNDKADLLKKINYYLANDKEREKIALNAYNKIHKKFTWQVVYGQFFKNEAKHPIDVNIPHKRPLKLNIENIKQLPVERATNLLSNMSEDYLVLLDKYSSLTNQAETLRDVAFIDNPEVVVNDTVLATRNLGEIATVRIHHTTDLIELGKLPISSFAFSKSFVKRNLPFFVQYIFGKGKPIVPLTRVPEKIAFPVTYVTKMRLPKSSDITISNKYEITLLNGWTRKRYLYTGAMLLGIITKLAIGRNLFILSTLTKKIKKYFYSHN